MIESRFGIIVSVAAFSFSISKRASRAKTASRMTAAERLFVSQQSEREISARGPRRGRERREREKGGMRASEHRRQGEWSAAVRLVSTHSAAWAMSRMFCFLWFGFTASLICFRSSCFEDMVPTLCNDDSSPMGFS